jgi:hypothetical protein
MPSPDQPQKNQSMEIADVASELSLLRNELRVLRDSIDDFREVVQWAVHNERLNLPRNELSELQVPATSPAPSITSEPTLPDSGAEPPSTERLPLEAQAAEYDLGRLSYLLRVMPKPDGFDQPKHYFYNLRLFFDEFQQEISYLQGQCRDGALGEKAKQNYWNLLYETRYQLLNFERTQEAFWIEGNAKTGHS